MDATTLLLVALVVYAHWIALGLHLVVWWLAWRWFRKLSPFRLKGKS